MFLFFWKVRRGIRLRGDCAGEKAFWHTDPAYRGRQRVAPRRGTPVNLGCFCFSGKCGGESACVGAVLGKWCSCIVTQLTGDARELLPAGAVQPVSAGFPKSVPLCGTPQLFTVACGHNPAYAGRCGGTSASLKCGREPAVPPTNAPLLKCGARVRWMAWLV